MIVCICNGYRTAEIEAKARETGHCDALGTCAMLLGEIFRRRHHEHSARIELTLIGKDLKRAYEISGNRLTVKSTDPHEHWKVVWERY